MIFPGFDIEMGFWIEREGQLVEVSFGEWGRMFEDIDKRIVARSIVSSREVITIFHGHNAELHKPPTYYSTAVFKQLDAARSLIREWHYCSREAATRGHRRPRLEGTEGSSRPCGGARI